MGDYNYPNNPLPTSEMGSPLRLKVCGMNLNPVEVANLKPDYLGFIFWKPSKRAFEGAMPALPHKIKKVGVFVDASLNLIAEKVADHGLLLVQLHGNESPAYCEELKQHIKHIKIIKVFSVGKEFDFEALQQYEAVCDFYLFDSKGKLPGGNGYAFDWKNLANYPSTKPFFLSGGIGLEEIASIHKFMKRPESQYCHAIDVNSRFELQPGLKDTEKLKMFKERLHFKL